MKKSYVLLIALFIVAISACKKEEPKPVVSIYGTWVNAVSMGTLVINANNTYTILASGTNIENGNCTISASNISFKPTTSSFCNLAETAVYTFELTATTLKLTQVNEGCTQRYAYLNLAFIK